MTTARAPALSAPTLLQIWERGAAWHPIDQALLVLQYACPERTCQTLSELTIGQRDTLLLEIRRETFGDRIEAYVECPACRERLEFAMSCEALLEDATHERATRKTVEYEGVAWELRAPNSSDLAVVAGTQELSAAKETLLARCVTRITETAASSGPWPDSVQAALAAELGALDPQAEFLIELTCQACGHAWHSLFDTGTFLWNEIRARSRRLLQEIDVLARTYGWAEAEILRLSETRRGQYVQMAMS